MPLSLDIPQKGPAGKRPLPQRFPVLLPLAVFIFLILGYSLLNRSVSPLLIGVIEVDGIILESEPVIKKIRELEHNPQVVGIIVRINSPGGAVAPSQEIFSEFSRVRSKKLIYTSIGSVAASGGYYIAAGTSRIFANPGSLTGSIGVIMQTFNVEKLMSRLGITVETIKAGKNKDIGSTFRSMAVEERELLESVLEDTHGQFISAVQENRKIDADRLKQIADGRVFTGRQALQQGLIDDLAGFRKTIEIMKKELDISESVQLYYPKDKRDAILSMLDMEALLPIRKTFTYTGLFFMGSDLH